MMLNQLKPGIKLRQYKTLQGVIFIFKLAVNKEGKDTLLLKIV